MASSSTRSPMPSFFQGAPWTKLSCMAWIVGHVVLNGKRQQGSQGVPSMLFASTGDLAMGLLWLAPNLRQVERELGSSQLLVWLGWVAGFGFGIYSIVGDDIMVTWSLPNLVLGATLAHYLKFVPRLHPRFVGILGMNLSEKALQGAWACYVLSHGGWLSVIQGCVGIVGSHFYFWLVPRHLPLHIPNVVIEALPWESMGGLFFLDLSSKVYAPLMMHTAAAAAGGGGGLGSRPTRQRPMAAPRAPPPPAPRPISPPSPEAIEQLTAMGFDEERARNALLSTNNSVERAANLLLME